MRHAALPVVLCCASIALFAGCATSHGPSPELMTALDSRLDCATRFHAAEKISGEQDRDLAYSQIALSAVDCRSDEVLWNCIDRISDSALKDDTAYRCAVALAKAGRGLMAGTIANVIVNSDTRAKAALTITQTTPTKGDNGK